MSIVDEHKDQMPVRLEAVSKRDFFYVEMFVACNGNDVICIESNCNTHTLAFRSNWARDHWKLTNRRLFYIEGELEFVFWKYFYRLLKRYYKNFNNLTLT